jgi:hypothetical protein
MEGVMRAKIIVLYLLVVFFVGSSIAFGSIQSEEIVITSIGRTPDKAVVSCLIEAIRQKRGVEIRRRGVLQGRNKG